MSSRLDDVPKNTNNIEGFLSYISKLAAVLESKRHIIAYMAIIMNLILCS